MAIVSIKNKSKSGSLLVGNAFYFPTSYESIETINVTTAVTSVTFSNIPSTYTHLQIRMTTKDNTGLASQSIRINGSSASDYSWHRMVGTGDNPPSATNGSSDTKAIIGISDVQFGSGIIDFLDYKNTNKHKTIKSISGFDNNGTGWIGLWSGLWMSTNAITSIQIMTGLLSQSWTQYSTFALYGIKEA
jgi:hypothetical protein